MARVAVTGGTGFIGRHLLACLAPEHEVRALARRPQASHEGITWVEGDLGDAEALRRLVAGSDVVIHVAALIKARRAREFFAANRDGTRALLAAVTEEAPAARLVHVSSLAAREPHLSPYAASKRAAEDAVTAADNLRRHILRPPAVYGPGDREIVRLLRAARRGILPAPGSLENRVSLIYGPDLAGIIAERALERCPESFSTEEVDDGREGGYSYRELAGHLAAALGRPVRPVVVPGPLLRGVGAVNAGLAALAGRPAMLTPAKARELLHPDWVARRRPPDLPAAPTDLARGLELTIAWAKARNLL